MTDTVDKATRSWIMSRVRGKDTTPEITIRRLVFSMGYRYRLHDAKLPGKPDLVFASRRKVILVHGCFWHHHDNCLLARVPKSRVEFWRNKLDANKARDARNIAALRELGWKVFVIWECELSRHESWLKGRIAKFLNGNRTSARSHAVAI